MGFLVFRIVPLVVGLYLGIYSYVTEKRKKLGSAEKGCIQYCYDTFFSGPRFKTPIRSSQYYYISMYNIIISNR